MRDVECPRCRNVNRVAGLYEAGRAEGVPCPTVLYCAYCGEAFTPQEATEEGNQEAGQPACAKV
jgi:hypothetical protein